MRRFGLLLLVFGVASAACGRADINAAPGTNAAGQPAGAPVATTGSSDAGVPAAGTNPNGSGEPRVTWREVTIPAGTRLPLILDTSIASNTSRVEQPVQAHLSRAVTVSGVTALPEGSRVSGVVTDAKQSGKVKGRAHLAVRFDTIVPRGASAENARYQIAASSVGRTAPATKKKDAMKIGAPAAGGAAIGAIVGGKKGALIGTAAGGGAGTAVVLSTRGKEVSLARGTALTIQLVEPLTVKVRG